jgi:hypothetical protein
MKWCSTACRVSAHPDTITHSTRQSGKAKSVTFRWVADNHLRDALVRLLGRGSWS